MRRLEAYNRVERLVDEAIERFELGLAGMTVLTETGSGAFVVTPLIAARAGASVVAVTRDSRYGSGDEVREYTIDWARRLGVADAIEIHLGWGRDRAGDADLVTNLGFVRPIDVAFITRMRPDAVVTLMCEPWEVRLGDTDIAACRAAGTPVLGTDECDPRVQTFRFVGTLALKLLFEAEVEVLAGRIVVVSSEPFATPIVETLRDAGADVTLVDTTNGGDLREQAVTEACCGVDAVVVAEHRERRTLIGGSTGLSLDVLEASGAVLVHIAGAIDDPGGRLHKHPAGPVQPGVMTVTTAEVGPRPVIDLHAAGLRVGQALVHGMRRSGNAAEAEAMALRGSPALDPETTR